MGVVAVWRRTVVWLAGVAGVGFAVTFAFTLWVIGSPRDLVPSSESEGLSRIAPGAELAVTFVFDDGTVGPTRVTEIPAELVGLTSPELAAVRPAWKLIAFAAERVWVEEACSDLAGGFLREVEGEVVVYSGRPDGCHRRAGTVAVDLEQLPPLQRAELAVGLPFGSEAELSLLLDGMQAP